MTTNQHKIITMLKCPIKSEGLSKLSIEELNNLSFDNKDKFENYLINESKTFLYPIVSNNIFLLLKEYAIGINNTKDFISTMPFDKRRVFDYYNQMNYHTLDNLTVQNDSKKWVDYRKVSSEYISNSLSNTQQFIPKSGDVFLDIASGTVGFKEYKDLSKGFELRICIDISLSALLVAKENLKDINAAFICGDITNIPLKSGVCDSVVSHHTLYHVPKDEQENAVNELYRVAKPNTKIVIVYCWFYHSWMMNITLLPVQLYRIIRHLAGKFYVKYIDKKPRLYFYPHSQAWFKSKFKFSNSIKFYSWRSANKYFLDIYAHSFLGGKALLKKLNELENKYPETMGYLGEYTSIVIEKSE